jgi:hypothetical protein
MVLAEIITRLQELAMMRITGLEEATNIKYLHLRVDSMTSCILPCYNNYNIAKLKRLIELLVQVLCFWEEEQSNISVCSHSSIHCVIRLNDWKKLKKLVSTVQNNAACLVVAALLL